MTELDQKLEDNWAFRAHLGIFNFGKKPKENLPHFTEINDESVLVEDPDGGISILSTSFAQTHCGFKRD